VILPMFCFLIYLLARRRVSPSRVFVFWVAAAALPFVYYAFIIDKGFAEISMNFSQHLASQNLPAEDKLTGYYERSFEGIGQGFAAVFGVVWPFVAAFGIIHVLTRKPFATKGVFFLLWLLGGSTAFLLPYFYPRFLIYMIPPMAWLIGWGMTVLGMRLTRKN
jgi:hypothetical protein